MSDKIVTFAEMLDHFKNGEMTTEQLEDVIAEELQAAYIEGTKVGLSMCEAAMRQAEEEADILSDNRMVSYAVH